MKDMNDEQWEKFLADHDLELNWTYKAYHDWPNKIIPIAEFHANRKKGAYEWLIHCSDFCMGKKRDRHGIVISGWFDLNKPYVARIDYKNKARIINFQDREKFYKYACDIYLKEGYNVEFITFEDEVTDELFNRLKQISV